MSHLIHDMVGHVAVHRPIPRLAGDKLNILCVPDRNKEGAAGMLRCSWNATSIGCSNLEVVPVEVN